MLITDPCVVSLLWTLSDAQGQAIDELDEPMEFYFGGDDLLPKLEEALQGQQAGFEAALHLEPEHAFGEYDAEMVQIEPRKDFPKELQVGMQFEGGPEDGAEDDFVIYRVTDIADDKVVLDGNHPLAGMALRLDVKVVSVRSATDDERTARSVADDTLALAPMAAAAGRLH